MSCIAVLQSVLADKLLVKMTLHKERDSPHLELLLQSCFAPWAQRQDVVDITVELTGGHLCFLPKNDFHQGIVDEDILLLNTQRQKIRDVKRHAR